MPGLEHCRNPLRPRLHDSVDLMDELVSEIKQSLKLTGRRKCDRPNPYKRPEPPISIPLVEEAPAQLLRRLLDDGDLIKEAVRRLKAGHSPPPFTLHYTGEKKWPWESSSSQMNFHSPTREQNLNSPLNKSDVN